MKLLTFDGNSYTIPTPKQINSNTTAQSQIKLIYRGEIFYTNPRPLPVRVADDPKAPTITLHYRGVTYQRKLRTPKPQLQPVALNWRWQIA